jgi:hypothetical protein
VHPDDLETWYDLVAHEFCHLIVWVYHRHEDETYEHGPAFQRWLKECSRLWGHLGVAEYEDAGEETTSPEAQPVCREPHCQNLVRNDDEIVYESQRCIDCLRKHKRKTKLKQRKETIK